MSLYLILTSFLLLQGQVWAAAPLSELINKLQTNELNCEEMTHDELAEHCAREVCGPPASKTSRLTANNIDKFLTSEQQQEFKEIESDVAAVFNKKKQDLQKMIDELERRKADPKLNDTAQWDEYDYSYFSNNFWKYIKWEIDSSKPLKERNILLIDESTVDPELLPGIKEFSEEFNKSLYDDPLYAYETGVFDFGDLKNAIKEKIEKLKTELSSQKVKVNFDFSQFEKELNNIEDQEGVALHFQKLENLANENGVVLIPKASYCKDNCKKAINHFVNKMDIDSIISNLKTSLNNTDLKDTLAECKANFISTNLQNNLSDNFEKIWPEVKSGFINNVIPRFSSHSQGMMKDYLDNGVHFYFENPTYKEFPNLKEQMSKKSTNFNDRSNGYFLGDLTQQFYDKDINIFYSDIEVCDPYSSPTLIWDSYLSSENNLPFFQRPFYDSQKDNISVSPYTCEHHREGSGILAHELGHAISNLMNREGMSTESLQDYRKIRSCASSQWDIAAPAERPYHPGDKQFTEEDSADIISYLAVNDGKSLYACGFLDVNPEETNYVNFDTDPWGNHSPGLIRLMREMSYKRSSIPQTCSALMQRHQDKLGDKKCF
ncbi:MAG: hypothetical protein WDA09_08370 [Bacteriovoracaceae bacterium]